MPRNLRSLCAPLPTRSDLAFDRVEKSREAGAALSSSGRRLCPPYDATMGGVHSTLHSHKLHRDPAERAEIAMKRVAFAGEHHAGE
jgi:hypothetical protein